MGTKKKFLRLIDKRYFFYMKKRDNLYNTEDLLLDKTFVCWQLFSSDTDQVYWEEKMRQNPELKKEIERASAILETMKLNNHILSPQEKDDILQAIQERVRERKKRKRLYLYLSGAACACITFFVFLVTIYPSDRDDSIALIPENSSMQKEIQLILSDNETMFFEQDADIRYQKDGNIIISSSNQTVTSKRRETKESVLNRLIVPRGKRSYLTLEDGTKVWVNSGTTLHFPSVFDKDKREISVDGEIYMEVARNEEKPFIVSTSEMKVTVLGTAFNVSCYAEDPSQSVVLVEGKVEVEAKNEKIALVPDQMCIVGENKLEAQQVDVSNYISWKDGILQFSSEPLGNILTRLSRYYDVPIHYEQELTHITCTGKLVLFDEIADIMESIYNTLSIKYSWEESGIYIEKRE